MESLFGSTVALELVSAVVIGAIIGSFINVVAVRLPPLLTRQWRKACREELDIPTPADEVESLPNLWRPRSHCPACKQAVAVYDNVPSLSWFILKGRCRHCGGKISFRYPLIELITAASWGLVIWKIGFNPMGLAACVFTSFLIALSTIDWEHQILPDSLTLGLLWLGLLINAHFQWFASPTNAIIGAALGYVFLWLIFQGYFLLRGKEGLGFGDLKLLAALGAWVGWSLLPFVVFVASVLGIIGAMLSIIRLRQGTDVPIAFGPYLAIAGWIALLWGPGITEWMFPLG